MIKPSSYNSCRRDVCFSLAVIVLISLLFGIGFHYFPYISDDLSYRVPFMATLPDGYIRLDDVWDTVVDRMYSRDNIRFANVLMIILLPFPKWATAVASAAVMAYALWLSAKLSGCTDKKALLLLLVSYAVFALPWNDQMYVFDFQLNYVWATAVMLYMLSRVLNGGGNAVSAFFVGLLAGMWHEGFSIPLMCGMIVLFGLSKRYRTKSNYVGFVGLVLGILWLITAPATMSRMKWIPSFASRYETVLLAVLPAVVYGLIALYILVKKRDCKDCKSLCFFTIVMASLFITLVTKHGPRVGWCSIWMSGLGLAYLLGQYAPNLYKALWLRYASTLICAGAVVHLIYVDAMCYRLGTETADILDEYKKNPDETIFHRMTLRQDAPLLCLQRPYYDWFAHEKPVKLAGDVYCGNGPKVVPVELQKVTKTEAERCLGEFFIFCNYIVGPCVSDEPCVIKLEADYGNGSRVRKYYSVPFVSEADGCEYAWYYPDTTFLDQIFGELIRITFPTE